MEREKIEKIEKLNKFLDSFKNKKVVIGLDGYPGSGETTLVKELEKQRNDILFIHLDDYVSWFLNLENAQRNQNLEIIFDKPDRFKDLRNLIQKSKKTVFIEGIFLLSPDVLGDLMDKFIFLDTDLELAKKRSEERGKERWGDKYISIDNPKSFAGGFFVEYKKYLNIYNPEEKADLILK